MKRKELLIGGIIGFVVGFFSIFGPPTSTDTFQGATVSLLFTFFLGNLYEKVPFFSIFTIGYWNYGFVFFATALGSAYGGIIFWLQKFHRSAFYGIFIGAGVAEIVLISSFSISALASIWYYIFLGFLQESEVGVVVNVTLYISIGLVGAAYGGVIGFINEKIKKNRLPLKLHHHNS